MKVAFIGLGNMGFPMAGHLAAGGHDVTVYNRTRAKAEAWTQIHGGSLAETPAAAAKGAAYSRDRSMATTAETMGGTKIGTAMPIPWIGSAR